MANVKFYAVKLKETFDAIEQKDEFGLYWILENSQLYKGDKLFGTGELATQTTAGLLSPEDKAKLDSLVVDNQFELIASDNSILIADTEDGKKLIGVVISAQEGNMLTLADDGLFVPEIKVPEYSIEKQENAEEGYVASYKLVKALDGVSEYVGATINIDSEVYSSGDGVSITDNKVSINIAEESNGLAIVDNALLINLATNTSNGAMSKEDKAFIDTIPDTYAETQAVNDLIEDVKAYTDTQIDTKIKEVEAAYEIVEY